MCGDAARRLRGYGDSRLRARSWWSSRRIRKTARVEAALAFGALTAIATVTGACTVGGPSFAAQDLSQSGSCGRARATVKGIGGPVFKRICLDAIEWFSSETPPTAARRWPQPRWASDRWADSAPWDQKGWSRSPHRWDNQASGISRTKNTVVMAAI